MNNLSAQTGRVCLSKSGRDKGRYFLIKEVLDSEYVMIVDGGLRKLDRPKKKKCKHLELKPEVMDGIAQKWATGQKVFDTEIRSAIYNTRYFQK